MSDDETYLTPQQLLERWNGAVELETLKQWRYLKRGPPFTRLGRAPRYPLSKLIDWEQQNTSEAGVAAGKSGD